MRGGELRCLLEWGHSVGLISILTGITGTGDLLLMPWGAPYWSPWGAMPKEQEVAMLNGQARMLEEELSQVRKRLEELQD